jgi:MFS family permease
MHFKNLPDTLKASIIDGIFYACMFGAGESYLGAFGVTLGLTPLMIGLLSTFPVFIGSLSQLLGVKLMERQISRKKIIVRGVRTQAVSWILIALIPWLVNPNWQGFALLICVTLYSVAGQIVVPCWTSLMGDLVEEKERGIFFGTRNKIAGYFLVSAFLICGYALKLAESNNLTIYAFTIIFIVAALSRYISSTYLKKHDDPAYSFNPDQKFTFINFIRRAPYSNFTKFVCFHALFNMAMNVASPYFVIYMLKDLNFTYWQFCIISGVGLTTNYLTMRAWGAFGDRYGNKRILEICCTILCTVPALWTLSSEFIYLVCLNFMSGSCVAGLQMAAMNFLLDAVTPGKRGRCAAYMNTLTAGCVIFGSLLGSFLISFYSNNLLIESLSALQHVFITSSFIRISVVILLLTKFREVRRVSDWSYLERFQRVVRITPLAGDAFQFIAGMFKNRMRK